MTEDERKVLPPSTIEEAMATGRILGRAEFILSRLQEVVHDLEALVEEGKRASDPR